MAPRRTSAGRGQGRRTDIGRGAGRPGRPRPGSGRNRRPAGSGSGPGSRGCGLLPDPGRGPPRAVPGANWPGRSTTFRIGRATTSTMPGRWPRVRRRCRDSGSWPRIDPRSSCQGWPRRSTTCRTGTATTVTPSGRWLRSRRQSSTSRALTKAAPRGSVRPGRGPSEPVQPAGRQRRSGRGAVFDRGGRRALPGPGAVPPRGPPTRSGVVAQQPGHRLSANGEPGRVALAAAQEAVEIQPGAGRGPPRPLHARPRPGPEQPSQST